jgi:hypothetical protein
MEVTLDSTAGLVGLWTLRTHVRRLLPAPGGVNSHLLVLSR